MAAGQGPVVQSALLRNELVRLRKDMDLTQEKVAGSLDWSTSKVIRIEGGKSSISKTDLQALLQHYGVTSQSRIDRLQELARGARETAWWNAYRSDVADAYLIYVGYEAGAAYIRDYHGSVVPGLLQTAEYAQVLTFGTLGTVDITRTARLRLQRQAEMTKRAESPWRLSIVDEAVIRRHVGIAVDPAIMPTQLRHIADTVEENERVSIRVLPFSAGAHLGLHGPFTMLEFDGPLSDVLYFEGGRAPSILVAGEDTRVTEYRAAYDELLDLALTEDQSVELIRKVTEELLP